MPLSKREAQEYSYSWGYSSWKQTKQNKRYSDKPLNLAEIRRFRVKQKPKRKLNVKGKIALFILLAAFAYAVIPFFIKNITKPLIFGHPAHKNVKLKNYNYIYSPTSKYLYNTEFMNTKMAIGTAKKPLMQAIYTTDEIIPLKNSLQKMIAENPKLEPSIFIWDMDNGKYVDIKGDTPFPAASIIKIPVMISMFKAIENGKFKSEDLILFEEPYRSAGSGSLQYQPEGIKISVDNLARMMITESDNSSTNIIMSLIGSMTSVNDDIKQWGLKNTHINTWLPDMDGTNYTTTKDLATMLYNLDNEGFLSLESRADIFDYMGHVKNNRLLAAGIPSNASIAHKTGDIGSMLGDAGIIYAPNGKKYILAIMVKRPHNDYSAKEFIVNASQTIYNYMTNY